MATAAKTRAAPKTYTDAYKRKQVERIVTGGISAHALGKKTGVPAVTLQQWVRQLHEPAAPTPTPPGVKTNGHGMNPRQRAAAERLILDNGELHLKLSEANKRITKLERAVVRLTMRALAHMDEEDA